ncbi:PQQ-binding-like beta-propeller repeat protein [Salinirubrum litoreum]|uniref:PQQ-binding-like beta-propeller repeat protein n=1 Tax=Salinirubrum litoreum TaxID=1126234 RepID=A0ABD5R9E6_9EURY|nr:PQQ-binding-like beta-propeller repeat protein [Salinirubrum litoreum]
MRTRTLLAVALLVGSLLAVGVVALGFGGGQQLTVTWTSDTARPVGGNHHAVAVADGQVYAPISGQTDSDQCALVALSAEDGTAAWDYQIPPEDCEIHAVADPTVADYDDDGQREVLAATTESEVAGFAPGGEKQFGYALTDYGYTEPVVADLHPAEGQEIVVADVRGVVHVFGADGTERWRDRVPGFVFAQPTVADVDADAEQEALVGSRSGRVTVYEGDGDVRWRTNATDSGITWLAVGDADGDAGLETVLATARGETVALDDDGSVLWRTEFDRLTAVDVIYDGDADGEAEVYVTDASGTLRSLDAATGAVEWTASLASTEVQMTPPAVLGDVDGGGDPELVVTGNDGTVSVVDPATGEVRLTATRNARSFTHATLADVDDDGREEVFAMYDDGTVQRLDVVGET